MNKICFRILFSIATITASAGDGSAAVGDSKSCTVGPMEKTFEHTKWLIYGCDVKKK